MQSPVQFYFDFVSPYGYLASTQIEALARRHGREVDWKPILLGVTVMKVMGLKPLMETPLKSSYIRHDKPRMARLLGVPLVQPDMRGVNSVAASRAFLWLKSRDTALATRFAHRVYSRLYAEGRDITSAEDLAQAAAPLGIDAAELAAATQDPRWKDALREEVDAAVARDVFGTPFFIVDGEPIWGVDRLWMLEHWLTHGNWDPAPAA